jgi:hypothetical protein
MKMRDILAEWKNFTKSKTLLKEGGNATAYEIDPATGKGTSVFWKGKAAQANPIVFDKSITREVFVETLKSLSKLLMSCTNQNLEKEYFLIL